MHQVNYEGQEIVIQIKQNSHLTTEQANELAKSVKNNVWQQLKKYVS